MGMPGYLTVIVKPLPEKSLESIENPKQLVVHIFSL